jgi:hypothetical protein
MVQDFSTKFAQLQSQGQAHQPQLVQQQAQADQAPTKRSISLSFE